MPDDKRNLISPELARKIIASLRDPAGSRRAREIANFDRVQDMVRMIDGRSDDEVAAFYQYLIDGSTPGTEQIVQGMIDKIKAARAAKLSS